MLDEQKQKKLDELLGVHMLAEVSQQKIHKFYSKMITATQLDDPKQLDESLTQFLKTIGADKLQKADIQNLCEKMLEIMKVEAKNTPLSKHFWNWGKGERKAGEVKKMSIDDYIWERTQTYKKQCYGG